MMLTISSDLMAMLLRSAVEAPERRSALELPGVSRV
jgi:hypothetical protein